MGLVDEDDDVVAIVENTFGLGEFVNRCDNDLADELALRHEQAVEAILGPPGRMLTTSKERYQETHPESVAVFNANVLAGRKVWWGDLALEHDEPSLLELAARLGETIYVLAERDARFANEDNPNLDAAIYSATPDGQTRFQSDRIERSCDGRLRRRAAAGSGW